MLFYAVGLNKQFEGARKQFCGNIYAGIVDRAEPEIVKSGCCFLARWWGDTYTHIYILYLHNYIYTFISSLMLGCIYIPSGSKYAASRGPLAAHVISGSIWRLKKTENTFLDAPNLCP